ncbi:glycosyltransferase [Haloarculaceae archaeon H-GB2-1]|nr:glycosyltransferase [Haloarculaceae archaeon H-GB11]MEA5406494.1 glycosyltransferase [Haloarculaceae archaeon H-GB2-1]
MQEFHDLEHDIPTRELWYYNPHRLSTRFGTTLAKPALLFANISFAFVALLSALRSDTDCFITREWPVAALFVLCGVPTVYSAHTVDALGFSSRARRIFQFIGTLDALRLVVANSQGTAAGMVDSGVPERKVVALPNAVDLDEYEPEVGKQQAREQTGLPNDERLAVYTGSLLKSKGAYELARASEHIDGKVVLVGGKPARQAEMETFVESEGLDDVVLVGRVDPDRVPLYQFAADVLVLPALDEAFETHHQPEYTSPLKLFEYMAARRPLVASDIPALHEILTDGQNALLVDPGSPTAIAAAADRLGSNDRLSERLVTAAFETVSEYTWSNRAERLLHVLGPDHDL